MVRFLQGVFRQLRQCILCGLELPWHSYQTLFFAPTTLYLWCQMGKCVNSSLPLDEEVFEFSAELHSSKRMRVSDSTHLSSPTRDTNTSGTSTAAATFTTSTSAVRLSKKSKENLSRPPAKQRTVLNMFKLLVPSAATKARESFSPTQTSSAVPVMIAGQIVMEPEREAKLWFQGSIVDSGLTPHDAAPVSDRSSPSPSSDVSQQKSARVRKFQPTWAKQYPWLRYDNTENRMYCNTCTRYGNSGSRSSAFVKGCSNFQL